MIPNSSCFINTFLTPGIDGSTGHLIALLGLPCILSISCSFRRMIVFCFMLSSHHHPPAGCCPCSTRSVLSTTKTSYNLHPQDPCFGNPLHKFSVVHQYVIIDEIKAAMQVPQGNGLSQAPSMLVCHLY